MVWWFLGHIHITKHRDFGSRFCLSLYSLINMLFPYSIAHRSLAGYLKLELLRGLYNSLSGKWEYFILVLSSFADIST
jgi:hypothetical protein